MKRALMISGFTAFISLVLLSYLPEKTQWILSLIFLVFSIILFLFRKIKYVNYFALILFVLFLSSASLTINDLFYEKDLSGRDSNSFSGYIDTVYSGGFVLKSKIDGEINSVYVITQDDENVSTGRTYLVIGDLTNTSNMSSKDARYYKSKGCHLVCKAENIYYLNSSFNRYIISTAPEILKPIWWLREKLIEASDEIFSKDMSGLMRALILNDKRDIPNDINENFKTSGLSHYLALSGQHTTIIAAAIFFLLKVINKRFAAIATAFTIFLYMALVGFSFSVTRAGIMAIITYIGMAFFLKSDLLNSLGISIIVILLFNPYSAADVSFQLSVMATLGVIVISPYIDKYFEKIFSKIHIKLKLKTIRGLLATTLGANTMILPYYFFLFGEFSLVSPLANLLAGPFMSLPIIFGIVALILSLVPVVSFLSIPLKVIAEISLRIIVGVSEHVSLIPFASVKTGHTFLKIWFIGTFVSLIILFLFGNKKISKIAILLSLTSLFSLVLCYNVSNNKNIMVYFADSYGGISTVITDKNSCVVVASKLDDYMLYKIDKILKTCGKNKIDLMIVSEHKYTKNFIEFLNNNDIRNLFYNTANVAPYLCDQISSSAQTFNAIVDADISVGERMSFTVRKDKNDNYVVFSKLDEVTIALPSGEMDLMHVYSEIKNADMFIIDDICPLGVEYFNSKEIFLTNEEKARDIYKKLYLLSDNIALTNDQTIIIKDEKYKCLIKN